MLKLLKFNSLRRRYALLTIMLAIIMFSFSWLAQRQMSSLQDNIQRNIESRDTLFQHNRDIQNSVLRFRTLLSNFQIDPTNFKDSEFVSTTILKTIYHVEHLYFHPWMKDNYSSTISELILTLNDFEKVSRELIEIRRTPQEVFPSLKISNTKMNPQYAIFTENVNLAIKEIEDNYSATDYKEYKLLVDLRFNLLLITSDFRIYLLNQLNSFHESFLVNQLNRIAALKKTIKNKLAILNNLDSRDKLTFTTTIALEKIRPAVLNWFKYFDLIRKINGTDKWRTDTVFYKDKLEPKLEKINVLLRQLNIGIEKFSKNDLTTLSNIAQIQVDLIWAAAIAGLFVLLVGFVFLVKLVLNPIATVTHALKDESNGIETNIQPNISVLETSNLITAFKEMRMQIHTRQQELKYNVLHDSLTGLANRELLMDRLEQAIHNAKQEQSSFAILIMDLDRFKEVNDTLGHSVGDKLLQKVAQRLTQLLREVDVIVRLGGDEFSVLLTTAHEKHAEIISKKIIKEFQNVFIINDIPLYIGISIGVSVYPQHGTTSQLLQQRADVAMYAAKRNKSGYEIYNQNYDEYSIGRLSLISDLRTSINHSQLFMEYQPIVDISSGKVVSAEALLRWNHPERGEVFPDEIIPIAEQTGLINPITYWIIDTVSKFNKKLKDSGINIKIAINLSVYNLQDDDFIENIIDIFNKNGISASSFIMEITESVMMTNPKKSIAILRRLAKLDIEIAVDDFGTGYSSLTYLKRFPISKIKIDKSFIMDMINDDNDAIIVRSTIDLAHNLGMKVIAEGIEQKESLDLLNVLCCELGQGYYISPPIPASDFELWIAQQQ